MTNLSREE